MAYYCLSGQLIITHNRPAIAFLWSLHVERKFHKDYFAFQIVAYFLTEQSLKINDYTPNFFLKYFYYYCTIKLNMKQLMIENITVEVVEESIQSTIAGKINAIDREVCFEILRFVTNSPKSFNKLWVDIIVWWRSK